MERETACRVERTGIGWWPQYNIGVPALRRRSPLHILALDTTSRTGSVAVLHDARVLVETSGTGAVTHGQRLPGDFARALEAAGVAVGDLDLLAVAAGPGSFTGLRVGIASIQGLAFARGLKVVPVSTLDALARLASARAPAGSRVGAWVDAHRGEVFAALYAADGATGLVPPSSLAPAQTLTAWAGALGTSPLVVAGDGAVRYRETIAATLGERAAVLEPVPALAGEIGRIAAREPWRAVLPHALVPVYVRRPDAELARLKRR
jgi:tRNA threonylcarbamoyladenosine biosynthesis protein TsaB